MVSRAASTITQVLRGATRKLVHGTLAVFSKVGGDAYQPYGNSGEGEADGSVHSGISNFMSDAAGSAAPTPRQLSRSGLHFGRKAVSKGVAQAPLGPAPASVKGGDAVSGAVKLTEKSLKGLDHPSIPKHMRTITEDSLEYRLADFSRPNSRGGGTPLKMSARSVEGSPNVDVGPWSPEGPGQPTSPFASQADLATAIAADGVTGLGGGAVGGWGRSGADLQVIGEGAAGLQLNAVSAGTSGSTEQETDEDAAPLLKRFKRLNETSSVAGKEAAAIAAETRQGGGVVVSAPQSPKAAVAPAVAGSDFAGVGASVPLPLTAAAGTAGVKAVRRTSSSHLPVPEHLLLQIPEAGPLSPLDRETVSEPFPSRDPSSSGPSLVRSSTSNTPTVPSRPVVGSTGAACGSGASSSSGGGGSSRPVRQRVQLGSGQRNASVEGASALGMRGFSSWDLGARPPGYGPGGGRSGAPSPSPMTSMSPASGIAPGGAAGYWGPGGSGSSVLPSPANTAYSSSVAIGIPGGPDEAVAGATVGAGTVVLNHVVLDVGDMKDLGHMTEAEFKASQSGMQRRVV